MKVRNQNKLSWELGVPHSEIQGGTCQAPDSQLCLLRIQDRARVAQNYIGSDGGGWGHRTYFVDWVGEQLGWGHRTSLE